MHHSFINAEDTLFEELLQELPKNLIDLAYEFKAFERARKVQNPKELFRLVLLYSGLDMSLRQTASAFTRLHEIITDSSVEQRLKASLPWLKVLLKQILQEKENTFYKTSISIIDGTVLTLPGKKHKYRVHFVVDLVTLELSQILVTHFKTGERLKNFVFKKAELVLADAGYSHMKTLMEFMENSHFIVRYNSGNINLFHLQNKKLLELGDELENQPYETVRTLKVLMGVKKESKRKQIWIQAYRLSTKEEQRKREEYVKHKKDKGKAVNPDVLYLKGWVILMTSIPPEEMSGQEVVEIYRARWQVELVIKRMKSLFDLKGVRGKKEDSILTEVWIYGKLIYATLIEEKMKKDYGECWVRLDKQRQGSPWRVLNQVRLEVNVLLVSEVFKKKERYQESLKVLMERPRKRKLQQLPQKTIDGFLQKQLDTFYQLN